MGAVQARIRLPGQGQSAQAGQSITVDGGIPRNLTGSSNEIPAIEWCIDDDCTNICDSAAFTVANIDGENTGKFYPLQLIVVEVRDTDVAGNQWTPAFKGRVLKITHKSDATGGSVIAVSAMDLGWHLTRCCATPLTSTASGTIDQLIAKLIDPTWGFQPGSITHGNVKNRQLKQGRLGISLSFIPPLQRQFIPIQVEPGQTPFQLIQMYAARLGLLVNVGVQGDLILFQPDYGQQSPYNALHYHASNEGARTQNNIIGTPTFEVSGEGLYSEVQCWSTVVKPTIVQGPQIAQNPNAQYTHYRYKPSQNPCPFNRLEVFTDSEAVNSVMGKNRAIWKAQTDAFNSWSYTVEVPRHSSGGTFFSSDTMLSVNDTVHQVQGSFYVQKVRRSQTMQGGTRTQMTLRLPWLLNPSLQAQQTGKGTVKTPNFSVGFVNGVMSLIPTVVK